MAQTFKKLIGATIITTFALSASHAWALNTKQTEGAMAGVGAAAIVLPAIAVGVSARLNKGDTLNDQIEAAEATERSTGDLANAASHGNATTAELDQLGGATSAATDAAEEATAGGSAFDAPSVMNGGAGVSDSDIEDDILSDGGGDVIE